MSEEKTPKTEVKVRSSKLGLFFSLILLVLIIFLAVIGYFMLEEIRIEHRGMGGEIERDDKQLQTLTDQITGYQKQLAAIQTQLATVELEVTNIESASANKDVSIDQTLAEFSDLQSEKLAINKKELLISIQQIKRQLGKTRGDWLIADAEYLLSVAIQRLHLSGDFHTTIEAMEAADQRLRESGDSGVIKVREQLAKELAQLNSLEQLDVIGVYSKIKFLIEKADHLAVFLPYSGKPSTDIADLPEQIEISGVDVVDNVLNGLKGWITIRRTDQSVHAIIAAEDANLLRQQLKVKLHIAIISLVHGNDVLYQNSLDDARSWIETNFTMNNDANEFIDTLIELKDIPMHSQLPDISRSLKMLKDITKLRIEADKALFSTSPEKPKPKPVTATPSTPEPVAVADEPEPVTDDSQNQ